MDYLKVIYEMAQWMKEYAQNAGAKGYVVGLSGGIDSSVVACLAVKAVGKENVIGISLPCQSRQDMKDDALEVADNLGIIFEQVFLNETFEALGKGLFVDINHDKIQTLTLANMKARLRMTALYAVANQNNYLVAGTGNKSELDVGYCTKYGDGGIDIEPMGNYYKTEVYKMAELMPEIPKNIITKAPSADLYEGQTDEQELGMTYQDLDYILERIEDDSLPRIFRRDLGDKIEKVKSMIKKAEHKNKMPPRFERI